ncbi:hypothetical protein FOMPIDRAFT_1020627 [Fomitopsis schrenkii]|uniref:Uncharacterized protein n=1 Tax=Fomitopsis schrenkii TaxID=2126942 RepID=S8EUI8_FOMSC|nr:hypothetical protein FOMPIDRAFT_1020627 [Fomitopsis schrenkii]
MSEKPSKKKGGRPPDKARKTAASQKAQALEDANSALQRENDELKARMREMEKRSTHNRDEEGSQKIPKPKGSPGNGYSLREEMGLGSDKDKLQYNMILRGVKRIAVGQGLNWDDDFKDHSIDVLRNTYKMAKKEYPILDNFANNWATAAIIQQAGISIHKYQVSRGEIPSRAERVNSTGTKRARGPTEHASTPSSKRRKNRPLVATATDDQLAGAQENDDRGRKESSLSPDDEEEGPGSGAE